MKSEASHQSLADSLSPVRLILLTGFHTADNENGAWPAQPLEHICPHDMLGTGGPSGHLHTTQYLLSALSHYLVNFFL